MFNVWDLEKFLKGREAEWWTPHEIGKALGVDIRTVKNAIRRLGWRPWETTYRGWRLDVAERGGRLYVVRMVRDIEGSENRIRAEISEVEGIPTEGLEDILNQQSLILKYLGSIAGRDAFLRCLENARYHDNRKIRIRNLAMLTDTVKRNKEYTLKRLNGYLNDLTLSGS